MALVCTGAILCILHVLRSRGFFLPRWIKWKNTVFFDGTGAYEVSLEQKTVSILHGDAVIWTSAEGVKVQDVLSCDIDHDGAEELILLCWKIGRYGTHRPFWVEQDENKWSQHIFVYEYNQDTISPKWMSSYIGVDVADMSSNQKSAPYDRLLLTDTDGKMSSWVWASWGFAKEETDVSFVVFGDNLIHEPIYRYGLHNDTSFGFLFENFRDIISESDVAVINQETPLTDDPAMYGGYPRFGTPSGVGDAIAAAGFDVVTCATNHMLDRGSGGVTFTKDFFDTRQMLCLGIQSGEETEYEPYRVILRNSVRFALLNYTYGTNGIPIPEENPYMVHLLADEEQIRKDIADARKQSDFVIIFAHWGTEYSAEPDEFQQKWAQIFLESGVDVVVGTHPHTLQPYDVLRDEAGHEMLIYYSVGNFISSQNEQSCVKGGMASFTVSLTQDGYRITEYDLLPLTITRQGDGRYTTGF